MADKKFRSYRTLGYRENLNWKSKPKYRHSYGGMNERLQKDNCPECGSNQTKYEWNGDLKCHNCGMQFCAEELSNMEDS